MNQKHPTLRAHKNARPPRRAPARARGKSKNSGKIRQKQTNIFYKIKIQKLEKSLIIACKKKKFIPFKMGKPPRRSGKSISLMFLDS